MAFDFPNGDGASNQSYLSTSSAPVTGTPLTAALWVNPDISCFNGMTVFSLLNTSGGNVFAIFLGNRTAGNTNPAFGFIQAGGSGNTFGVDSPANSNAIGTWVHIACVFESSTSRTLYRNGGVVATNTTSRTPSGINQLRFGTDNNSLDGKMADCGVWDAALTADEINSLAKGFACSQVRPSSLKFYAPLIRDLQDVRGGLSLTNNNNCAASVHPRIYA